MKAQPTTHLLFLRVLQDTLMGIVPALMLKCYQNLIHVRVPLTFDGGLIPIG